MRDLPTSPSTVDATAGLSRPRAVLVVDDHDLFRLGVRALLQAQAADGRSALEVLEAASLAQAFQLFEQRGDIDLVLLDLALPDAQGLGGLVEFRQRFPQARLVVLSGIGNTSHSRGAIAQAALALGASAFLPKSAHLQDVVAFVRACGLFGSDGPDAGRPAPPAAASRALADGLFGDAWSRLKPQHAQVLQLLLEGKSNKEIAQLLALTEGTVKNYVSTILLLFGVRSRAQLISALR